MIEKNPQDDAHVRLFLRTFTATQRMMWTCPRCQSTMRNFDRPRDRSGRLLKSCGCRARFQLSMSADQLLEHKRQVKIALQRKYRQIAAEKEGRILAPRKVNRHLHDAHVVAFFAFKNECKYLHDAHVKRYHLVLKWRAKAAEKYRSDPQAERARQSRRKQELPDSYVIQNLKSMGIERESVTPYLIELKREAMQYRRIARNAKRTVINLQKENHETITNHA